MRGNTENGSSAEPGYRRWLVSGKVQGVGFRYHVLQFAESVGVVGDVRNLDDGRVEIRAQGSSDQLERLLEAVRRGPAWSQVERVDSVEIAGPQHFERFRIR